ncbi:polyprenyl synthetase family protein [Candidatus Woesearchaeota archaeon]|nr:polyprenyl synthetase family protein [Candidatus Woesearchaeota archaeon]
MSFKVILGKYRKIIDKELDAFLTARVDEIKDTYLRQNYAYAKNYVLNGGKRLRPIALIMACKGVSSRSSSLFPVSLSVELLHNATLVQDDVMDEDDLRRNNPAVHKLCRDFYLKHSKEVHYNGNLFNRSSSRYALTNAVCIGNILQTLGVDCLFAAARDAQRIYSIANRVLNDGQILDNYFELRKKVAEPDYFDMVARKTGNLFRASVQIGAVIGKANKQQYRALSNYAILAATAFQLKDDLMDVSRDTKKGSTLGSDIKKGKKTLLLIKALENCSREQKKLIDSIAGNENASPAQINKIADIYHKTGAVDYVNELAETKIIQSKEWLARIKLSGESRSFFEGFADYMFERKV